MKSGIRDIWVTSDLHFGHVGICNFLKNDGTKVRPWDNYEEMDEELVKRFNDKVKPDDTCYILGDVVINRRALTTIARLNCRDMVLIKGNHDLFRLNEYTPYFRDIRAYMVYDNILLSHIPVHPQSLERWGGQIHGHLHNDDVLNNGVPDPRYFNVCVEKHDFAPILLQDAISILKERITG